MQIESLNIHQPGQVLDYAGVIANLIWPMMKSREKLLIGQVVACLFMLSHFAMINAYTGALVMATAGVQAALAIPLGRHPSFKRIYLASLVATPLVCYATWHGFPSIFSSAALAVVCVANFQAKAVRQRALLIVAILAWIAHNVLVHSVPALVSNGLALLISSLMLYRIHGESTGSPGRAAA